MIGRGLSILFAFLLCTDLVICNSDIHLTKDLNFRNIIKESKIKGKVWSILYWLTEVIVVYIKVKTIDRFQLNRVKDPRKPLRVMYMAVLDILGEDIGGVL